MSDNEAYYDKEIAPLLKDVAQKLEARGMPFIAFVGHGKDTFTTRYVKDFTNPAIRLALYLSKTLANVDALFMAIERDAEEYGDNSIYLYKLKHYAKLIREGLSA